MSFLATREIMSLSRLPSSFAGQTTGEKLDFSVCSTNEFVCRGLS